jgi:hypothetical protein
MEASRGKRDFGDDANERRPSPERFVIRAVLAQLAPVGAIEAMDRLN